MFLGSMGALVACGAGGDAESATVSAQQALEGANVQIAIHDASGKQIGVGSGVLIAPRLVLTAGHLVAGNAKWKITTSDGTSVMGYRAITKDWMDYDSLKSHPRKTDVGVIYLDHAVDLKAFPKLATERQTEGTAITRVRAAGVTFQYLAGTVGRWRQFSHAYNTDIAASETLDTGGAVVNDKGQIVGVVTGRGMQTGKLHIARTDQVIAWLGGKVACAGGKLEPTGSLGIRTYGTPATSSSGSSGEVCDGGGAGSSGSSSSSGSSGSSGGAGDELDKCDDGGGACSGDCDGYEGGSASGGGSNTGSNTSGNDGATSSPSGGGAGGSASATSGSGTGASSSSGGTNTSGNDGTTSSSSGGGAGGSASGSDQCTGPSDNPDVCPPEQDGCVGASCGGGTPDSTIDYGGSAGTSPSGAPNIR